MRRTAKLLSLGLLVASYVSFFSQNAHADLLYFDNFEQFPNGTTLTKTNYVPASGPSGATASFIDQSFPVPPRPSVTASNFLGSTRAFLNWPNQTVYGNNLYTCSLAAQETNQILSETWTLWISQSAGNFAFSGLSVTLPGNTNGGLTRLVDFSDSGEVIAQTSSSGGTNFFSSIGSWQSLAGTVMTNQLIVNYPAQTFSFFLNGTMLASIPFSGGFTNVDVVGQMGFEWDDPFRDSLQFALDDVRIETVPELATLEMVALGVMVSLGSRRLHRDPL